ncbi:Protein of unknown function [Halopenitus malekzadehii]|uniref:DUF2797 domain-containing protein n=1 Tax=Halopenitus malekzadehii TaxID=1267564 RepID=A0A1H6I898_9EURY|nr:DUF2797 domain-containing protein [Halopenitus malekzadehii]SEH42439.1 Protein of unknown function [Halopenitus malekzadehii]
MQIVGYETGVGTDGDPEPAELLVADRDGGIERIDLSPGRTLTYDLDERHCAGTIHDGAHIACSESAAPYCAAHRDVWVCARCTGTCLKDEMDCHDPHAIYLAAFAPSRFKVGVTRLWRLETRLREQGADRAAHVRTVENGRIAREIEAGLAADVDGLVDRVRVETKRAGLAATVDAAAWERLLDRFDVLDRFTFEYGLDLTDRPMAETMLTGRVVGTKGRLLVLERAGSTYAVDLRDLVGHEVVDRRSERDLQASLGAFGG